MKCTKNIPLIFSFLFSFMSLHAQWDPIIIQNPGAGKFSAGIYGAADYSSNAINSTFAASFLEGNYIGNNLKNQVSSNLQAGNRLGASLNAGIIGVIYGDSIGKKSVFNFFIALRNKNYLNANFPPDVFNLAFYGNAPYAGESVKLSPFNLNSLSYQQIEIGALCTNLGGKAKLGLGVSFLAGQNVRAINMSTGYLYTDPYGEYLQLNSDTKYNASDSTPGHNYLNGFGASIDIYFSIPYKIAAKSGILSAGVTDLGFMKWNASSLSYNKDTSYLYTGITINSLNDLQNAAINNLSRDSLQNRYFPLARKSFYTDIPATVSINANTDLGKVSLELGAWYIFNANCLPDYYIQGDKTFSHGWRVDLQLGYGGYTTYNASLGIKKQIKNTEIKLAIDHLEGIVVPNELGGAGAFVEIVHSFK